MKLKLNKKKLKNLSKDAAVIPNDMTPQIAGGESLAAEGCQVYSINDCGGNYTNNGCGPTQKYCHTMTNRLTCNSCGCHSDAGCNTYTCY